MGELELREVGAEAAAILSDIICTAFGQYDGVLDPPSGAHKESAEQLARKLNHARSILALVESIPAGCVIYEPSDDMLLLGRLAVLPEFRGRGVATALVADVEQRAVAAGATRVRLGVRVALPALRAWYERLGYRLVEERRHEGYDYTTYVILDKDVTR